MSPIGAGDPGCGFTCGKRLLDRYFHQHALGNDTWGVGRTYVVRQDGSAPDLPPILGYYTLAPATIAPSMAAARTGLPYPSTFALGAFLIARLAVDERCHRQGFGEMMLNDAFDRCIDAAVGVGGVGIVVHAKDPDAMAFYSTFDFEETPPPMDGDPTAWPRHMFLPLDRIRGA